MSIEQMTLDVNTYIIPLQTPQISFLLISLNFIIT